MHKNTIDKVKKKWDTVNFVLKIRTVHVPDNWRVCIHKYSNFLVRVISVGLASAPPNYSLQGYTDLIIHNAFAQQ